MRSMTKEISELRAMNAHELAEKYEELFGKKPRIKHREWLWKRLAWKIQEQRFGGLPDVSRRHLSVLMKEIELPIQPKKRSHTGQRRVPKTPNQLAVGTTLTRTWHGHEYRATVLENGIEYDGVVYRSLSAVAKEITGSKWNGRLFWGLTKRSRK